MNTPRLACWLIGLGLLTVVSGSPSMAEDAPFPVLQQPPAAEVSLERFVEHTGAIAADHAAEIGTASPEPTQEVAPRGPPRSVGSGPAIEPAPAADAMMVLPALPEAPVAFTAQEQFGIALARRLADDKSGWHPRLSRKDREAVAGFYAGRQNRPLWIADGAWTAAANAIIARLREADEDGMEQGDYAVPAVGVAHGGDTPVELSEAELRLAISAILYARDARGGRIDPTRLSSLITPKLDLPAPDAVLARLAAGTPEAGAALASFQPRHPGYLRLKDKLAALRASRPSRPMVRVPAGPVLRLGMRDARVPLIRARFGLGSVEPGSDTAYDERVASAVADFQRQRGLPADGSLTRQTIVALSGGGPSATEADLIANMERWRWLPADLGERYIAVNVPEFRLRLMENGVVAHETRVITGKPETPTPIFSGVMDHAIVNPSWNIPPSILKNEFLPRMAEDPLYAEKRGYQVVRRGNSVSIRQPPGERNALGFIKFMFPNQHAVYLHDTPNRTMFGAERRAFSHGCVRVEKPFELAEEVLGQTWSEERLKRLIGRGERTIRLGRTLPVHLTYFTVSVDESGALRQFDDLYGYNRRVRAALGLRG